MLGNRLVTMVACLRLIENHGEHCKHLKGESCAYGSSLKVQQSDSHLLQSTKFLTLGGTHLSG
jgi:hypothetical protein